MNIEKQLENIKMLEDAARTKTNNILVASMLENPHTYRIALSAMWSELTNEMLIRSRDYGRSRQSVDIMSGYMKNYIDHEVAKHAPEKE